MTNPLPKLITFDGDARSGKGTIVSLVKDYLRDECHKKVMLIDAGQVFRVLTVMMLESGVDLDDPFLIDKFLSSSENVASAKARVKAVYQMDKAQRDALLYTDAVSVNSAKIGARPGSHVFTGELLRKWLVDARNEGYEIVLLDGRALGENGAAFEREKLCEHVLELFFVCDPRISALRTLKLIDKTENGLTKDEERQVSKLMQQISARNKADRERKVQPVTPPIAPTFLVSELPDVLPKTNGRLAVIIDRSVELPRSTMALPVIRLILNAID